MPWMRDGRAMRGDGAEGRESAFEASLRTVRRAWWLHRLFGVFDQSEAISVAQLLADHLPQGPGGEAWRETTVSFILGILRQALMLHPFNGELFRTVVRWSALFPSSGGDTSWIHHLHRLYREEDRWRPEGDMLLREAGADLSRLTQLDESTSNPMICYEGILAHWQYGNWEQVRERAEKLVSGPYGPFVSHVLAYAAFAAGDHDRTSRWLRRSGAPSYLTANLAAEMALL